ncbi:MAG: SCO family protein [Chitinophagales bacterium]|nr:SCO family protein [Chitinophagales bacterium]
MKRSIYSKVFAAIILFGFPFGFYYYYKGKIDALPKKSEKIQSYWAAPAFKYETHNGDTLSSDSLKGKIYVADFIFTNCNGVCPNLSKTMAQLQETFKNNSEVKFVTFSVDPERDSISVLKNYAANYGAVRGKWYFLRGDKETVWKMAEDGFKVPVVYTPEGGKGSEFTHTPRMILVDDKGMIRGFYNGTEKDECDSLNNNLAMLLVGLRK